jgi:hypothetical protein
VGLSYLWFETDSGVIGYRPWRMRSTEENSLPVCGKVLMLEKDLKQDTDMVLARL